MTDPDYNDGIDDGLLDEGRTDHSPSREEARANALRLRVQVRPDARARPRRPPRRNERLSLFELLPPETLVCVFGCLDVQSLCKVEIAVRWKESGVLQIIKNGGANIFFSRTF